MGGGGASERLDLGRVPLEQFQVAEVMPSAPSIRTECRVSSAEIFPALRLFPPAARDFSRRI